MVSPYSLHDFPRTNVEYPHSIPVKSNPLQILQSVGISKLQGLWVTGNPRKFEIPAL
jgi:hypothetical protein